MCGINGITFSDKAVIAAMNQPCKTEALTMKGLFVDESVSLATAAFRLSNLSPAGHSRCATKTNTVWMVYNGEVYNFSSCTRSSNRSATNSKQNRFGSDNSRLRSSGVPNASICSMECGRFAFMTKRSSK
jgi:asparagine synthetase B (glutamine-hydrolysing)